MTARAATDIDSLTELALALPAALRELVAYRIWESLHPEEGWSLEAEQVAEIQRRGDDIDAGRVELVDGEKAIRDARARIQARRR